MVTPYLLGMAAYAFVILMAILAIGLWNDEEARLYAKKLQKPWSDRYDALIHQARVKRYRRLLISLGLLLLTPVWILPTAWGLTLLTHGLWDKGKKNEALHEALHSFLPRPKRVPRQSKRKGKEAIEELQREVALLRSRLDMRDVQDRRGPLI